MADRQYIDNDGLIDLGNGSIILFSSGIVQNFYLTFNASEPLPSNIHTINSNLYGFPRSDIIILKSDLNQSLGFTLQLSYLRRNIENDILEIYFLFWNSTERIWKPQPFSFSENPESFSYARIETSFPKNYSISEEYAYVITSKVSDDIIPIWRSEYGPLLILSYNIELVIIIVIIKFIIERI